MKKAADELQPIYTIQPIQRFGKSHKIAAVRLFLASDEASYVCDAEFALDGETSIRRYRGALPGKPGGAIGII